MIAAEAGDLRYYINALHIALLTVGRSMSRALFLVAFVRKSVEFALLFVRKSVEFASLFVRKSVYLHRVFVRKSVIKNLDNQCKS